MAAQQQPNDKPVPATPAAIGDASVQIAGLLSKFTATEQSRIIRAAATINGLETKK
ncbi:MAG TPA: hypothetical protein VNG33_19215 [Polyangiaceae bacterium]|nr:hypothetical protein [Polyangiaceae bacterium]